MASDRSPHELPLRVPAAAVSTGDERFALDDLRLDDEARVFVGGRAITSAESDDPLVPLPPAEPNVNCHGCNCVKGCGAR